MDTTRELQALADLAPLDRARRAEALRVELLAVIADFADARAGAIKEAVDGGTRPAEVARQLGVTQPVITKALQRVDRR